MEEQKKQENTATDEGMDIKEQVTEDAVESAEVIDTEETDEANDVNDETSELERKLEELEVEKDEFMIAYYGLQAEYDNFKRRTLKEREADRKYKSQDLVNELLPALDNFERALQVEVTEETKSIMEGIPMVYNQLQEALKSQGVEEIETVEKEFDPNIIMQLCKLKMKKSNRT